MRKKNSRPKRVYSRAKLRGQKVSGLNKAKKPKNKYKRILAAGVILVAILFCGKMFLMQRTQLKSLLSQKKELETEIAGIQENTAELHQEVSKLDDPEYIKVVARKEYGMVGKEDKVFVPARTSQER